MTTVRAEIKYLHTPDIEPATYVPEDPARFAFLVQVIAGPAGEPGEESFGIVVCTAAWLAEEARRGPFSGRHETRPVRALGVRGLPGLIRDLPWSALQVLP